MNMINNSIVKVEKARAKLQRAFEMHFARNIAQFEIGVNPEDGKYTVVALVCEERHIKALPVEVDGYQVFSSIKEPPMKRKN